MGKRGTLFLSIAIFLLVAAFAVNLILNKGYLAGESLISYDDVHEMSMSVDKEYLSLPDKEKAKITVYLDEKEITEGVTLTVSEGDVVELNDNTIEAKKVGTATITAKIDEYDLFSTAEVVVYKPIKNISLSAKSTTLKKGNDRQLTLVTVPDDATRTYLTFESSNPDIATVNNNGIVTGKKPGTVTITVTDGVTGLSTSIKQEIIQ